MELFALCKILHVGYIYMVHTYILQVLILLSVLMYIYLWCNSDIVIYKKIDDWHIHQSTRFVGDW